MNHGIVHDDVVVHLHADCVSWSTRLQILAVACYQLLEPTNQSSDDDKQPSSRYGAIYFYVVIEPENVIQSKSALKAMAIKAETDKLLDHYAFPCGIFDMKWIESYDDTLETIGHLIVGLSDGSIVDLIVQPDNASSCVVVTLYKKLSDESKRDMVLGIDFLTICNQEIWESTVENVEFDETATESEGVSATNKSDARTLIAESNQSGSISIWNAETSQQIWQKSDAHSAEVWQVHFIGDGKNSNQFRSSFVSGSDDASFKIWDIRAGTNPIAQNTKHYQMGVTSFASPMNSICKYASTALQNQILVGSYDESLSLWDLRSLKTPVASYQLGGGVWRLKWLPTHIVDSHHDIPTLAVATMHAGFKIISISSAGFEQHTSSIGFMTIAEYWGPHTGSPDKKFPPLAYGVDWIVLKRTAMVAGCTFYDNRVSIWKY